MPGVPSGRACDECRKQKKKCDQIKPICSRCKRLNLECKNNGAKRFKFIHIESVGKQQGLVHVPLSECERLANTLNDRLGISDVPWDLACFGAVVNYVPQRLGSNKALDTAADLFTTLYSMNMRPKERQSPAVLVKYGKSLRALQVSVQTPGMHSSADTMCAAYMIMVCQSMIQETPGYYARGLVALLQSQVHREWHSPFEIEMLRIAFVLVLMESVGNPSVVLDPWLPQLLDQLEPRETTALRPFKRPPRMGLRSMAETAVVLREPANHYEDIRQNYDDFLEAWQLLSMKLKQHRKALSAAGNEGKTLSDPTARMLMLMLSQTTATSMALNKMLQVFEPNEAQLPVTMVELVQDVKELGDLLLPHRPLGSLHILPGLSIAWAVESDPERRDYIARQLFQMYDRGFPIGSPMKAARWWKKKFAISKRQIENSQALATVHGEPGWAGGTEEQLFIEPCHVQ